jgi:hypothetical protein
MGQKEEGNAGSFPVFSMNTMRTCLRMLLGSTACGGRVKHIREKVYRAFCQVSQNHVRNTVRARSLVNIDSFDGV